MYTPAAFRALPPQDMRKGSQVLCSVVHTL